MLPSARDHRTGEGGGSFSLGYFAEFRLTSQRWRGWSRRQHIPNQQFPDTPGASQPPTTELVPPLTAPLTLGGFEHTRHRRWAAIGKSTISTWGFKNARHKRCAANGRDTTPDIRACTGTGLRVTPTTACIKGKSQSSIQPSLAISVPAPTPPTTPQLPSATSPSARPPTTTSLSPSPSLPPRRSCPQLAIARQRRLS